MIDAGGLAGALVGLLAPHLPQLLSTVGDTAGKTLAGEAADLARTAWAKISQAADERPTVREAAADVAANTGDDDAQAALRLQLRKLLTEDPTLARELSDVLTQARTAGVTITASGERSVAVGGSVGGDIITGDQPRRT